MAASSSSSAAAALLPPPLPAPGIGAYDDDDDDDEAKMMRWERLERTWDALQENEQGQLISTADDEASALSRRLQRRRQAGDDGLCVKKGLYRNLFVVVDASKAMLETDLKPTRLAVTTATLERFVREFFDQNPISQLGLISTSDAAAEKLTDLSGNPNRHITALKRVAASGDASLQNALEVAKATLRYVPRYGAKEVLIVFGALTTRDPADIFATIRALAAEHIRVSVVGLSAEVYVLKALSAATGGSYFVATSDAHLTDLLWAHLSPPAALPAHAVEPSLIRMGFPSRRTTDPSLCVCHQQLKLGGYFCPQCHSKYCELPTECGICGLLLVSSPHLARSYHHLFPVPRFEEEPLDAAAAAAASCYGCQRRPLASVACRCPRCHQRFCLDCDVFIHEVLHNCPGCENLPKTA